MKIQTLAILSVLAYMSSNKDLYEKREGICSTFPSKCPKSKQLKGICCRNPRGIP